MAGRANFLPYQIGADGKPQLALPGILAGAVNAVTAPYRAMNPQDYPDFNTEQEAADFALNMMGGGTVFGRAPKNALGMFAGVGAKTANREALLVAERMKAAGAPDEEIYKATGWFFGSADGKPRFEIDDSGAQLTDKAKLVFTPDMVQLGRGKYQFDESAPDLMPHPELEAAYPFYKNIGVKSTSDFSGGSYSQFPSIYANDGQSRLIKISQSGDDARSTAFHELQHAIQRREGFARGGSPEMFSRGPMFNVKAKNLEADLSRNLTGGLSAHPDEIIGSLKYGDANELNSIAQKHGFSGIDEAISFLKAEDIKRTPFGQYQRLAGEAEARLTQSRMDMTGAERAASYPPGMYDVPVSDQIVRYGEGPALATTWHGSPHKFEPTESQAIARYREIKGAKSVVRMEAALRTAGVPLPKNEPVAYIQSLVDRAHRRN
jgi:hypothetical protein